EPAAPTGARRGFDARRDARREDTRGARRTPVSQFLWRGGLQRPDLPGGGVRPEEHRTGELVGRMARCAVSAHRHTRPGGAPVLQPESGTSVCVAMGVARSFFFLRVGPAVGNARLGWVRS